MSDSRLRTRQNARRQHDSVIDGAAGMGTHMLAALMLFASVLFLAWVRVGSLHRGYELSRLRAEQDKLLEDGRGLQIEIGTLRSPIRLSELARHELGMVPAQASGVVDGKEGRHE